MTYTSGAFKVLSVKISLKKTFVKYEVILSNNQSHILLQSVDFAQCIPLTLSNQKLHNLTTL